MIPELAPLWLSARAKNAVRRPVFVGGVSAGVLITTIVALIAVPQQRRQAQTVSVTSFADIDTVYFRDAVVQGKQRLATAESTLMDTRARAAAAAAVARAASDALTPAMVARRDSVSELLGDLQALLTTAETAPLPSSYRALASSPTLAGNARVRALIDSLGEIERERDALALAGGGGTDPIFVALTSRLTELGQAIQSEGEQRRESLRAELAALPSSSPRRAAASAELVDTTQWLAERDSARSAVVLAEEELEEARERVKERIEEAVRAHAAAAGIASPLAFLGAAIVFGMVIGFGTAFFGEARRPRVADAGDAERATSLRAIATIRTRALPRERMRRRSDRSVPSYIDPGAEAYQQTYLHVARKRVAAHVVVTIAADEPRVAAIVAANLAAIAAEEARTAVVVDSYTETAPVAGALGLQPGPGLADIAQGRSGWADATQSAALGRGRMIDVVPSGAGSLSPDSLVDLFHRDSGRLTRYYDAIFVTASLDDACAGLPAALPLPDTIVCARVGDTTLRELAARVETLRIGGAELLGLILWDADLPTFAAAVRGQGARKATDSGPAMASVR